MVRRTWNLGITQGGRLRRGPARVEERRLLTKPEGGEKLFRDTAGWLRPGQKLFL